VKNYSAANRFIPILFSIIVILSLIVIPNNAVHAQTPDPGYSYLNSWGGDGRQLLGVHDVAVGPDGRIYIVNSDFDRVTIYDPSTKFFTEFGNYGSEDGQFYRPYSVAVSDAGIVYVADGWYRRMQMFDANGNHIKTFSEFDMSTLDTPFALALDSQQNLLLLKLFRDQITGERINSIIKFNPQGEKLFEYTIPDDQKASFTLAFAQDIAVDSQDNIIVASSPETDSTYPTIIKISSDFTSLESIVVTDGENSYGFSGIDIDNSNKMYLTTTDHLLLICNSDGTIAKSIGGFGSAPQQFNQPKGLAVDSEGRILVSEYANSRVQILDADGNHLSFIGSAETPHGFFHYPGSIDHYNDEIYVADTNNSRVEVFNRDGSHLRTYSNIPPLVPEDQSINPAMVRMDPFGNLILMDYANYTVQTENEFLTREGTRFSKVNQAGIVLASMTLQMPRYQAPQSFEVDELGNVYIPVSQESTIWAYNNNLQPLEGWTNPALFTPAYRVDVDSMGNILVGQRNYWPDESYELLRLDKTGQLLATIGEIDLSFTFNDYLVAPVGFSSDSAGNNYAFFSGGSFVRKYDADFNFIAEFGQLNTTGYWARMARFKDIEVAESGRVYLVDSGFHAIQVFAPTGSLPSSTTGLIQNGDFTQTSTTPQAAYLYKLTSPTTQAATSDFTGLSAWTVGGLLGVSRSTETSTSDGYSMRLGAETIENPGLTDAWAYQTFNIPAGSIHNQLSFNYRVVTNDILENSDFSVLIYDGNGLEKLEELVHAGIPSASGTLTAGTDLGWQTVNVNLDAYRGRMVRILFQVRNLNPSAQGIWAFVEHVQLHNEHGLFLPLITR